jgi:hypothetical protein
LTPDTASGIAPPLAKAIVVARAVVEAGMSPEQREQAIEYQFDVVQTGSGWRVTVARRLHRSGSAFEIPSRPTIILDREFRYVGTEPGA